MFYYWKWSVVGGKLKIQDVYSQDNVIPLKQLPAAEGSRTLGMKIDPSLNFHDATKYIINKIVHFQTEMHGAPLSGTDANTMYRSFFTPAVFYGVEAISLTPKQCEKINKSWTVPWLHRLNFSQTTNIEVRHMLREDGGLELFKIEDVMMIKKIKVLMGHLRKMDRIGLQIKSNLEHLQIYSGLDVSVLEANLFYKHFWTEEITSQFKNLGAHVVIKHWLPTPLVIGERTIISKAMELYNDSSKVGKINEMRMHLKIVYLSEIGKNIQFYKHKIKFPDVKKTKGLQQNWNQFIQEVQVDLRNQKYCGSIETVQWWKCGEKISNGNSTYQQETRNIYSQVEHQMVPKQYAVRIQVLGNAKIKVLQEFYIDHSRREMSYSIMLKP